MKLRYFRAKNILSFGDEEVNIEFSPFSVIAGPNDSGKTNLFRALGLIGQAFDYGKLLLEDICFKGDNCKALQLEVGMELDDTERELLAKLIVCGEAVRIKRENKEKIIKNEHWRKILLLYGYQIIFKSFKTMTFVLSRNELRVSEPRLVLRISEEPVFFINSNNQLSETDQEVGSHQQLSLGEEILDDFLKWFTKSPEIDVDKVLEDSNKLSEQSPALKELFKGKLSGNIPPRIVEMPSGQFYEYQGILEGEPFLRDLSRLLDSKGIDKDRLYFKEVIKQLYSASFVNLNELRLQANPLTVKSNDTFTNIHGTYLAKTLFWLASSGTPRNRGKYSRIQKAYEKLTKAEFDVVIKEKEVDAPSQEFGVITSNELHPSNFSPLVVRQENKKQLISIASVQIVKDDFPIALEQSASGLYEILFLLTQVIGENGKILLLDEPELHLHPSMQNRILNLLTEFGSNERNQIVLITHSPYLVNPAIIGNTWRFTTTSNGTRVHNIGKVLSNFEASEKGKFTLKLSIDVRALLFSRGVILVEGLSDKIVIEQVDRYLSAKEKRANIDENEWHVLEMGSKNSLLPSIKLCRTLDIPSIAILDEDALMSKTDSIELKNQSIKTSVIFSALKQDGRLKDSQKINSILSEASNSERYEESLFKSLQKLAMTHHIFALSSDLEGVLQIMKSKRGKPLQALEQIIKMISQDKIPSEFQVMCDYIKSEINELSTPK